MIMIRIRRIGSKAGKRLKLHPIRGCQANLTDMCLLKKGKMWKDAYLYLSLPHPHVMTNILYVHQWKIQQKFLKQYGSLTSIFSFQAKNLSNQMALESFI